MPNGPGFLSARVSQASDSSAPADTGHEEYGPTKRNKAQLRSDEDMKFLLQHRDIALKTLVEKMGNSNEAGGGG